MIKHIGFITPLIGLLLALQTQGETYGLWNWFKYSEAVEFVNAQ
jgi:hypothetical protein